MSDDHWHVDLPFRGPRPYVHSAAICNHLRDRFGSVDRFEITFKTWMAARVVFAPVGELADAKGQMRIDRGGETQRYAFTDDPAHPVEARVPYDEEGLVADAAIDGAVIAVAAGGPGSAFDRIVAANKVLINRRLDPQVKLIASKIVTTGFPADDRAFQLRLDSHLGTRIFRSALLLDGEKQGEIIFYGQ